MNSFLLSTQSQQEISALDNKVRKYFYNNPTDGSETQLSHPASTGEMNYVSQALPTLKNHLYIANCQLSWLSFAAILFVFGWLVDNQLVPAHTKIRNFPKIIHMHRLYSIVFKKIKNQTALPHHYLKKSA